MSQPELLRRVVDVLNQLGIDYMLTGSVASSMQGEPRSTHDIDLVVEVPADRGLELADSFPPPDFYLSADAIRQAVAKRSMFNLLSIKDGDKVDFWMLKNNPFDQSRFSRKRTSHAMGFPLKVSTPEDIILAKLKWADEYGGSEKQFTDALRVYEVQYRNLDFNYLNDWVPQLKVESLWSQLKATAEP